MVKENETEKSEEKSKIATHTLLLADGKEADSEEKATGFSYELEEHDQAFTWQVADAVAAFLATFPEENRPTVESVLAVIPPEVLMFAIFGGKTLATNVTSGLRNKKDAAGNKIPVSAQLQHDEVVERFSHIRAGKWYDRTREPGAPRVDKDKLAEAILATMLERGTATAENRDTVLAERRKRLDTDAKYMADCRAHPTIAEKYNALVGRATIDLNAL